MRRFALRAGVIDRPNARSSHTVPTPRGGGLGAIAATVVAAGAAATWGGVPARVVVAAGAAVGAVAAVGWLDDRYTLPVLPRLATHVAAALVVATLAVLGAAAGSAPAALVAAWWLFWTISAMMAMPGASTPS